MPVQDKVSYGFITGEVSPDFYGRTDLSKYDLGLALCKNFFVDFCGGIRSRPGFEYSDRGQSLAAYRAFNATQDDYLLEFTPLKLRFLRYGRYLLEAAKSASLLTGNVITITAHGWESGDLVTVVAGGGRLLQATLEVVRLSADTLSLKLPGATAVVSLSGIALPLQLAHAYTKVTPYTAEQLRALCTEQSYNRIIITHPAHETKELTYISDTNWSFGKLAFGSAVPSPSVVKLDPSATGNAGVSFVVTAVVDGNESAPSPRAFRRNCVDYASTAGSMRINWGPVPNAEKYNLYRTLVLPKGKELSAAQQLGYIGTAYGVQFVDKNIVADFTKAPPQNYNPFAPSQITGFVLNAPGKNYLDTSAVTITDPTGSGFVGYPIVMPDTIPQSEFSWLPITSPPSGSSTDEQGLLGINVVNGGEGYTAPTVSVANGTGADLTVQVGPATGTYPSLCRLFQQRMVFAGTDNEPMRLWASKPGTLSNMDVSEIVNAGDGYSYQLDSREIRPIKHLLDLRSGLLIFTDKSIVLLRAEEGKAVSAVSALAEPQAFRGANDARPVVIELDVIFAQKNSSIVNAMLYTEYTNSFQMQDLAILAKHLVTPENEILRFAWQSVPHKLLWALRKDGTLLSLTYDREQEVFAWAQHTTQGRIKDIIVLQENGKEVLYALVERNLGGVWGYSHERILHKEVQRAEDWFGVDCGLSRALNKGVGKIFVTSYDAVAKEMEISLVGGTAPAVGTTMFFFGGRYEITSRPTSTSAVMQVIYEPTEFVHGTDEFFYCDSSEWEYALPITVVTGLWHLEGKRVIVNADGDVIENLTVSGGQITLPNPSTKVSVGLPYICEAKTLPPVFSQSASEALTKDIIAAHVRLKNTRGIEVGSDKDALFEMKDSSDEDWGDAQKLRNDFTKITLAGGWDPLVSIYIRQRYPLPAHILSLVQTVDVGDTQ